MPEEMSTTESYDFVPPYVSFTTLRNLFDKLGEDGLPAQMDRSILSGMSGGYQAQILATLRAFDLIDDHGTIAPRFAELVQQPDRRSSIMAELLREYYPGALELGRQNATQKQLEDYFRGFDLSGSTVRRAISFFLNAAEFAGIELSPHFSTPRATTTPRKRRRTTSIGKSAGVSDGGVQPSRERQPDINPLAEAKSRYIEILLQRIESSDELNVDLLDRVEHLLGFRQEPSSQQPATRETELGGDDV